MISHQEMIIYDPSIYVSNKDLTFRTNHFKVYPNPAKNNITIETPNMVSNVTLTIFDIKGQELIFKQLNENKSKVDISSLSNGAYIVKIESDKISEVLRILKE